MKNIAIILVAALALTSCKNTNADGLTDEQAQAKSLDSMRMAIEQQKIEIAKQKTIDSMNAVNAAVRESQTRTVVVTQPAANGGSTTTTTTETKKKGWSNTAKGAVIGAGVGAVTGAVVDKKQPGKGAVIGGLIGAGAGAGTGAIIDSEKKKKEQKGN
jgi:hypothetical protein